MKIVRNNVVVNKVSENIKQIELSNITLLTSQTPIFGDYYSIDVERSETVPGFKTVEQFIGPESRVVYNKIENMPVYFNSDFTAQVDYNQDELGQTTSFNINGTILPSSVQPKANDFFVPYKTQKPLLLRVNNYNYNDFKDTVFYETSFDLASMNPEKLVQLNKQLHTENIFTMSSIGTDKFAVIEKKQYEKLTNSVNDYLEVLQFYKDLFFNEKGSVFTFNIGGAEYEDMIFMDFLIDNSIISCDPVVTFARSNSTAEIEQTFIAYPFLDCITRNTPFEYLLNDSVRFNKDLSKVIYGRRILQEDKPNLKNSARMGKLQRHIIYKYDIANTYDTTVLPSVFSLEIMNHIKNKEYDLITHPLLKAIAKLYNKEVVDFSTIEITSDTDVFNYYLIPLLLWYYRKYIETLK